MNESENCGDLTIDSNLLEHLVNLFDETNYKPHCTVKKDKSMILNSKKSKLKNGNSNKNKISDCTGKQEYYGNTNHNNIRDFNNANDRKNKIFDDQTYYVQNFFKFNNNNFTKNINYDNININNSSNLRTPNSNDKINPNLSLNFVPSDYYYKKNFNSAYTNSNPSYYSNSGTKPTCNYNNIYINANNSEPFKRTFIDNNNINQTPFYNNLNYSHYDSIKYPNQNYNIKDQDYIKINHNQMKMVENNQFINFNNSNTFLNPYNLNNSDFKNVKTINDNKQQFINNYYASPSSIIQINPKLSYFNSLNDINQLHLHGLDSANKNNKEQTKNSNNKEENSTEYDITNTANKSNNKNFKKMNTIESEKSLKNLKYNQKSSNTQEKKSRKLSTTEDSLEKQNCYQTNEPTVTKNKFNSKIEVDLYLSLELKLIMLKFSVGNNTSKSKAISNLFKYVFDKTSIENNYLLHIKKSYIFYVCCTKKGSKLLQNLLPLLTTNGIKILFKKIEFFIEKLIYNQFGNFFIQEFIKVLKSNERIQFIHSIESSIISLCEHKYGNHTMQLLFQTTSNNTTLRNVEESLVISLLSPTFKELAHHEYAVYVLEQIAEHFLDDTKLPLFKFISNSFYFLVEKDSGIKLLKKFIKYYKEHDKINLDGKNNIVKKNNYDNENYYISPKYSNNSNTNSNNNSNNNLDLGILAENTIRNTFLLSIIKKFHKYALLPKTNTIILQIISCWKIESCRLLIEEITKNFYTLLSSNEGCLFLKKLYKYLDYVSEIIFLI